MNNYQNEIIGIFDSAKESIKVAVSWFTDELLLESLIQKAENLTIEVLLSSDEVNILRHKHLQLLKKSGGRVRKLGSNNAKLGEFMHSKFVIIDDSSAFGGSYNFTVNARTNFENFKRYSYEEVQSLLRNFRKWMKQSVDFFIDIHAPEKIIADIKRKFEEEKISDPSYSGNRYCSDPISIVNHKENIIQSEIKKEEIRRITKAVTGGTIGVSRNGSLLNKSKSTNQVKPHKYYGGRLLTNFDGKKKKNSYAIAYFHKMQIEKEYDFIKCEIVDDALICKGRVESNHFDDYIFKIEFRAGEYPQAYIVSPDIEKLKYNHVYREGSLCLFYPPDLKWKDTTSIAHYTIPWVVEWIYLYELWMLSGKWEAPEQEH